MDLHFTQAAATTEEREVVDALLGNSLSGDSGREHDDPLQRAAEGAPASRSRRDLLLPVLHAIQARFGWIRPGALNYVCARLTVPPAEAYGVATFYAMFSVTEQPQTVVHVCDDIACKTRGADALCAALEAKFGPADTRSENANALWKRSPCLGLCDLAPAALCQCAGEDRHDFTVAPTDAEQILAILHGAASQERAPAGATPQHPHASLQRADSTVDKDLVRGKSRRPTAKHKENLTAPTLLARVGIGDPLSLDDYRAKGGYQALRRALEIGPTEVVRLVTEAHLTGRGGAAFPTGIKWKAVAEAPVRPHYLVCNADESEPGTFKDHVLMEEDPYAVIESLTVAGFACGAEKGYLYIRGEYPEATRRLQNAIDQARNRGLLGNDIMARGTRFDIEIRRGAGAYICGEETALLNSIEGRRGEPRNKPPFPTQVGLFGKPTAVNNVETLVNVIPILVAGPVAYASTGTGRSTGTRLFCLSGCVERPGVYEAPYGVTLRMLVDQAGGVRGGRPLQSILLGGAAGVFVQPDQLDIVLTLEGARAANVTLGSGVVLVFDDTIDMKPILLRIAAFFRDESCGQCVPCRVGTVRQEEALSRLLSGQHLQERELTLLAELEQVMKDASICGLGQTASSAISSAIPHLGLLFTGVSTIRQHDTLEGTP